MDVSPCMYVSHSGRCLVCRVALRLPGRVGEDEGHYDGTRPMSESLGTDLGLGLRK